MKTVIISYERISPVVLDSIISRAFNCLCYWKDINEDFFEFIVCGFSADIWEVEDALAEYV